MTHEHNCYPIAVPSFQGAQHPKMKQSWPKGISKDVKLLQRKHFQGMLLRHTLFDAERGKKQVTRIMPFLKERRNTNDKSTGEITVLIQSTWKFTSILYMQWRKMFSQSPHYTESLSPIPPALVFLNKLYVTIYNWKPLLHTGYLSIVVHTLLLFILRIGAKLQFGFSSDWSFGCMNKSS